MYQTMYQPMYQSMYQGYIGCGFNTVEQEKNTGALDRIRTCGFLLRRQTLYPLSYKGTPERLYAIMVESEKQIGN